VAATSSFHATTRRLHGTSPAAPSLHGATTNPLARVRPSLSCYSTQMLRRGQRVVRLCTDRTGRYVSSHVWTIVRVSRRDKLIIIADKHGPSRWTYDLEGHQREGGAFVSELVELRD
jgi:hypothetical protein